MQNGMLLVAGFAAALLLAELVLRWQECRHATGMKATRPVYSYDARTWYAHTPSNEYRVVTTEYDCRYRINALGLRDEEMAETKPAHTRCVLFVGDSFTFGTGKGSDRVWHQLLENEWNSDTAWQQRHGRLQCINAGVGGYNTEHELLTYCKWAERLHIDAVVVGFLPNDIRHNHYGIDAWYNFDAAGVLVDGQWRKGSMSGREFATAAEYWRSPVRLFVHAWHWLGKRSLLARTLKRSWQNWRFVYLHDYAQAGPEFATTASADMQLGWEATARLLRRFKEETEARHDKLLIVALPQAAQLMLKRHAATDTRYNYRQPEQTLAHYCEGLGIPLFAMIDHVPDTAQVEQWYYPEDGHLTEYGDAVVARALYPVFRDWLLSENAQ